MKNHWLIILSGPLLFGLIMLIGGADNLQFRMLGVVAWMLSWWITSALPIGATALLPIVLFPLLGIMDIKETTANFANPVIYLFLGGFILGLAIEKWALHKRIALNIIRLSGDKPVRIILGSMLATALLSMWISNTATAVMMLPIGMSVVKLLGGELGKSGSMSNFGISLMLGIAYAANIGGITTLIGTPPNLVLASIAGDAGIEGLSFSKWLFFALPLVILLFGVTYLVNTRLIFPIRLKRIEGVSTMISTELQRLGGMQAGKRRVMLVMVCTALLWIFRAQLSQLSGLEALSDPLIAILASLALFIIPDGKKTTSLLVWEDMRKLPWGILLLFGGGISLARGMEATDIVSVIGNWISSAVVENPLVVILVITAFAIFLTEVMSNVALVSVFIPVAFVIAENFGLGKLELAIPLTIGASCAFMFPISTPPNAIVFSSGYLEMKHMARMGIVLNLLSIALISLYCYWVQPLFY